MQHAAAAPRTFGDAAVDGLLAGAGAGLVMALYLVVAGVAYGDDIPSTLSRFDPASGQSPVIGALAHLAVASIYGALFGLSTKFLGQRLGSARARGLAGTLYGLGLYVFAAGVLLPAWGSFLQQVPAIHFAIAHLLYGVTLGLLAGRKSEH